MEAEPLIQKSTVTLSVSEFESKEGTVCFKTPYTFDVVPAEESDGIFIMYFLGRYLYVTLEEDLETSIKSYLAFLWDTIVLSTVDRATQAQEFAAKFQDLVSVPV